MNAYERQADKTIFNFLYGKLNGKSVQVEALGKKYDCTMKVQQYNSNSAPALKLLLPGNELYAIATVNMEQTPPIKCMWMNVCTANTSLRQPLLDTELFEDTGKRAIVGNSECELWRVI